MTSLNSEKFSHITYCTGLAQLVYLLCSLEITGLPPDACLMYPYPGSARNNELKKVLIQVSKHLGFKISEVDNVPRHSIKRIITSQLLAKKANKRIFWYCRGIPFDLSALAYLEKSKATYVYEYYDGYRSPIVAKQLGGNPFSFLKLPYLRGELRQFMIKKLLEPDKYFIPQNSLWNQFTSSQIHIKTNYFQSDIFKSKLMLVGRILAKFDNDKSYTMEAPGVILITGMFAERQHNIALENELLMYENILRTVRSISRKIPILTKTHPRSSNKKMSCFKSICATYNAHLYTGQQLFEFIIENSGFRNVIVIAPPTTALLNTLAFDYGPALCLSRQFMASYMGNGSAANYLAAEDHALMTKAGVKTLHSLSQLAGFIGR